MREHMVNGFRQRSLPALVLNGLCEILPTAYDFAPNAWRNYAAAQVTVPDV